MTTRIRVGNGCGFWGDSLQAPVTLAERGRLDYLTLEYLAELTMSILALQKQKDPTAGYAGDFVGTAQSAGATLRSLLPGGTALLYGVHEAPLDQFDLNQIVLRDLKVFGALSDRVGWERVIQLVESGQLRLKALITHSFPLERGAEAFALVRHRADGVVKAVITS